MNRVDLLNTLKLAAPALLNDNEVVLPILKSFLFTGTHVVASNDVITVCLKVDPQLKGIVPGKKLISFLSACNTKETKFDVTKKGNLQVKCSRSKLNLPMIKEGEWPFEFPDIEDAITVRVGKKFFKGIEMCSSQSPDTGLGSWMGSIIFILGKVLGIYGVGRGQTTISYFKVKSINAENDKFKRVVIPSSFCKVAVPMSKQFNAEAKLHITKNAVVLDWGEGENIIACKLVNIDMPDVIGKFRGVMKEDLIFTPIKDTLIAAMEKAAIIGDKGVCNISSKDVGWEIQAKAQDGTTFKEEIPFTEDEGAPDISENVAADLITKRFDDCSEIAIYNDATVMRSKNKTFVYMIGNRPSEEEEDE